MSKIKINSLYNQFTTQLGNLVGLLMDSSCHFVKCIRPNEERNPALIDSIFVIQQLQASGVLESIRVHSSGYEYRESIELFVDKFWPLTLKKEKENGAHVTFSQANFSFKKNDDRTDQLMPGSLEDYVHRIFVVVANGMPDSPAHPAQKQWALGVTQVFMKGPVKKLI